MSQSTQLSTTISQYIASTDEEDGRPFSRSLASILSLRSSTLLQFIQGLGPILTSESELARSKALECLATTLEEVDPAVISKQDVSVLIDFLIAKLDDTTCVLYVLRALITIIKLSSFKPSVNGNLEKVIAALFTKYDPRKHLAKVRYHSFNLIQTALETHYPYIHTHQTEIAQKIVEAFIHIASGEKDPRNLLISFAINTKLNTMFDFDPTTHKQLINDLFDVCFCYFPITFTPPPNDPYKIKAEDLKGSLESTIASQSLFARDAFSGLLEKLTSTNPVVRNDVLRTLYLCVDNYHSDVVLAHWLSIWSALKFEILHNDVSIFQSTATEIIPEGYELIDDTDDNKVLIQTLAVIRELQRQIIKQDVSQHKHVENGEHDFNYTNKFLESVTADLKESVATVSKSFKQAVIILALLGAESPELFSVIVGFLFSPEIWGKYIGGDERQPDVEMDINELAILNVSKQRELIDCLGFVLISFRLLTSAGVSEEFMENNKLLAYKDHLLLFLGQLLQTTSNIEKTLKCKIVQQLIALIQLPGLLTVQEVTLIFGYFKDILSQLERENHGSWDEDIVVKEIIKGSVSVVEDTTPANAPKKTVVTETLLPFLMDLIVPEASSNAIGKALGVIKSLSINHQFLEVVSIRLLNKITHFLQLSISIETKADAFKEICQTLLESIMNTQAIFQFLTNSWYKNFVPRFLRSFFDLWSQNQQPDVAAVEAAGNLVGAIVRFLDKSKHQTSLNELTSLFLLPQNSFQLPAAQISVSSSPLVGLFNQIIANVDKSVSFEEAASPIVVSELINDITCRCQDSEIDNGYTRLCYLQMLAILSNKLVKDATLFDPYLQPTYDYISTETGKLPLNKVQKFEVLVWITKGLVMKLDQKGMELTQKLVSLLSNANNEVQQLTSRCLGILVCDLPIFTISSTSKKQVKLGSGVTPTNVRLLYKQRLFDTLLPLLMEGYQNTKDEVYLVSLSILVENVLSSLLKGHLDELSSMVTNSLPINNPVIVGSALKTLKILIDEAPELVKPHLNTIIERLIALVVQKIVAGKRLVNAENVRCEALVCLLKIFQNLELEYTVPYQKGTIKKLEPALDDKKRLVRKYCCDLRQVLYELGR